MKISTRGRYALRAVVDLARNQKKGRVCLKDIAGRQALSVKYLEAIFTELRKKKILKSKRGADGGFLLAKAPGKISALNVILAIEKSVQISPCVDTRYPCKRTRVCRTRPLWRNINAAIKKQLAEKTVADLMEDS
jgi:Rrf2 family protein